MNKQTIHTFVKGMNKDIDKSVISNNSYLEANNFRISTSGESTSGAFENIKGNKLAGGTYYTSSDTWAEYNHYYIVVTAPVNYDGVDYDVGDVFHDSGGANHFTGSGLVLDLDSSDFFSNGQIICGASRIRDYIVVFTTNNTSSAPDGGRSMIWKLELDKTNEDISTISKIYDDNLNNSAGTLDLSTANKIKIVSKYETPNIQKIYWTDGYNHTRYLDLAKTLTVTGEDYTYNNYMAPEMFEFLPLFVPSKPVLNNIITGRISSGVVQYSYQLYRVNGSTTVCSPLSDSINVVSDSDFAVNTNYYKGDGASTTTGKGFKIEISNSNEGYDRLRLIRLHYATLNSVPTINVVAEIEIDPVADTLYVNDVGTDLEAITLDEFNISSTELFSCQDLSIKNNRLFAANIVKDDFTVDDWDARAVRFRNYYEGTGSGTDTAYHYFDISSSVNYYLTDVPGNLYAVDISIPNFQTVYGISPTKTITSITNSDIFIDSVYLYYIYALGWYTTNISSGFTISNTSWAFGTLSFRVTALSEFFIGAPTGVAEWKSLIGVTYDWTTAGATPVIEALVTDSGLGTVSITQPVDPDDSDDWDDAGWDNYSDTHDGVNNFNDPDNDGDDEYAFIYQSDGSTIGAEGPNIKLDFETEEFVLDSSNLGHTFYAEPPSDSSDLSYSNYASPWKGDKLSWQRDETYRLFIQFGNNRGQESYPQWICDYRMPSLHDADFTNSSSETVTPSTLVEVSGTDVVSHRLYPRIYFKSFPANAAYAKILRTKRERQDRSVVTQGLAITNYLDSTIYRPNIVGSTLVTTDNVNIIKMVSPEININQNISQQSNDYIEYATYFSTTHVQAEGAGAAYGNIYKLKGNTRVAYSANTRSDINDVSMASPLASSTDDPISIGSHSYGNYYENVGTNLAKGCTGLLINYTNNSWSAEGVNYVLINYKSNVADSQYGGNTYESRNNNISYPCSDLIFATAVDTWFDINGGDTFINYFDVSTLLFDLSQGTPSDSYSEVVFIPLESSINCDLRYDNEQRHFYGSTASEPIFLRQEYSGDHTCGGFEYNQTKQLYLYNSVYSQQISAQYAISELLDTSTETNFDCLVKASNVKTNGELSDSWTKFNANEELEVDSNYGEIKAIATISDKLLFWQEDAFGVLSVNVRSLIQDSVSSELVLGTGGVLDRYDYLSTSIGAYNRDGFVSSDRSIYWFYDKDTSIYKFDSSISNLTKDKGLWSWFKNNWSADYSVHGIYDREYNEVIFTLYKYSDQTGYTLAFNELTDQFTSFYDFVPYLYIDYKDGYLSTKRFASDARSLLFFHNSEINHRCRFYSLKPYDTTDTSNTYASTVSLIHNEDYPLTKVYDNILYISSATDSDNIEQYSETFDQIRCYNDYQNTDWVDLTYGTNVMHRERNWTLAVPRNLVNEDYTSYPNIFTDLSTSKEYEERMRDKYMVLELSYDNTGTFRFVVPFIGIRYRVSYR